jgi:methyl-accepting chemotaxis protein
MAWNSISLRAKLLFGFGTVCLLLIATGIVGYSGVGSVAQNAKTVILGDRLDGLLAQREVDLLNLINKVNGLWTDPHVRQIDVETDDHKCGFGRWLYGEGRKQLENTYPDLAAMVQKMEAPHHQLHVSVIEINRRMGEQGDRAAALAAAGTLFIQKTKPALAQVQGLLRDIRHSAKERIISDQAMLQAARNTRRDLAIMTIGSLAAGLLLAKFIATSVSRPTAKVVAFAEQLARGDFTRTVDVLQKDEVGQLAKALNNLVDNLGKMLRQVNNGVTTLTASSNDLSTISGQMNQGSEQTSSLANTVAAAAEEMSANMGSVAAASEQASTNVNMVATATEEMSATVNEIAQNSEKARAVTAEAVSLTQDASVKVDQLGAAAQAISKFTEVITEISEQTNLLALNATIEAARAGEAGKGFAVVANEIKELAKQTAQATQEIKAKISGIQTSTGETVGQIKEVCQVIHQVNEIVATIATAVEEQSAVTREIAENVSQASKGIQEVNTNVAQSAEVAGSIYQEIAGVNMSADEMATSSSQVNISAHDLQKLAGRFNQIIGQYRIKEARFDIGAIKGAHLQWRSKLEGLLHGRQALRPEEVASHHQCAFGKWYDGPDSQLLKSNAVFETVGHYHEKVHTYARRIVDLYHQGEQEKGTALMNDFEKSREKLFEALDELYLA